MNNKNARKRFDFPRPLPFGAGKVPEKRAGAVGRGGGQAAATKVDTVQTFSVPQRFLLAQSPNTLGPQAFDPVKSLKCWA